MLTRPYWYGNQVCNKVVDRSNILPRHLAEAVKITPPPSLRATRRKVSQTRSLYSTKPQSMLSSVCDRTTTTSRRRCRHRGRRLLPQTINNGVTDAVTRDILVHVRLAPISWRSNMSKRLAWKSFVLRAIRGSRTSRRSSRTSRRGKERVGVGRVGVGRAIVGE